MIVGITEQEQKLIKQILSTYKQDYVFYYYGSRVKGGFEKTSDLDVFIKGKHEMPLSVLTQLKEAFDVSSLPFVVNLSDYHSISETSFNLVKKDLVPVYDEPKRKTSSNFVGDV